MLLNFARPQLAPNIVSAPNNNVDVNSVLGLAKSQYDGLQSVGDTGYYYGDGRMYQPYTPSPVQYGRISYGIFNPIGPDVFGMPYRPQYNPVFGLMGGVSARGGDEPGTIRRDGQAFKPYTGNIPAGFAKVGDEYEPSMAYVNANTPKPTFNATPNVTSFLSTPTANVYNGNYGAGRFLNTGNLLGFNFGTPSGQTAGGEATS